MSEQSIDLDAKISMTDAQVAALRERHGLGPDEDVAPYLAAEVRAAVQRAVPQMAAEVEQVEK